MNAQWVDHLNISVPADRVDVVDERLGATGSYPSIYFEDPFGYVVELKSPAIAE